VLLCRSGRGQHRGGEAEEDKGGPALGSSRRGQGPSCSDSGAAAGENRHGRQREEPPGAARAQLGAERSRQVPRTAATRRAQPPVDRAPHAEELTPGGRPRQGDCTSGAPRMVEDAGRDLRMLDALRGAGAGAEAGLRGEIRGKQRTRGRGNERVGSGSRGHVDAVNSSLRDELSSVEL
jgi:hypothetical protein